MSYHYSHQVGGNNPGGTQACEPHPRVPSGTPAASSWDRCHSSGLPPGPWHAPGTQGVALPATLLKARERRRAGRGHSQVLAAPSRDVSEGRCCHTRAMRPPPRRPPLRPVHCTHTCARISRGLFHWAQCLATVTLLQPLQSPRRPR